MIHLRLADMVKGWFVGDFAPAAVRSSVCEVAVKHYRLGDHEDLHHHRIATEVTVVVSGAVEMMGRGYGEGDIIVLAPHEATGFRAMSDACCVVVKLPGVADDKYPGPA